MRRRIGVAVLVAAACLAGAAIPGTAATPPASLLITGDSIAGAKLGRTVAHYRVHFRAPGRLDHLEDGWDRLAFAGRNLDIYFRVGTPGAAAMIVPGRRYRTNSGVGPCSKLAALESAYGHAMRPVRLTGKIVAYRVGNLTFGAERPGEVTGVMLAKPNDSRALFLLVNAPECVPANVGSQP